VDQKGVSEISRKRKVRKVEEGKEQAHIERSLFRRGRGMQGGIKRKTTRTGGEDSNPP